MFVSVCVWISLLDAVPAGDYAVHALWTDTTTMNTDKAIPYTCHGSLSHYTLNCTHVPTTYGNNDTDNQAYWTAAPIHQNYEGTASIWKGSIGGGPNRKGDNGWQVVSIDVLPVGVGVCLTRSLSEG